MDAMDLIAFIDVERQIAVRCERQARSELQRQMRKNESESARADSVVETRTVAEDNIEESTTMIGDNHLANMDHQQHNEQPTQAEDEDMSYAEHNNQSSAAEDQDLAFEIDIQSPPTDLAAESSSGINERTYRPTHSSFDDRTPEPEPQQLSLSQPKKQTLTVPINFGDEEEEEEDRQSSDKENSAPPRALSACALPASTVTTPARSASAFCHRTPATVSTSTGAGEYNRSDHNSSGEWNIPGVLAHADLDRAAALAAIRYRRGRAKSFVEKSERSQSRASTREGAESRGPSTPARKAGGAGAKTPKTEGGMKRNISTPAGMVGLGGTMSVGRKARH